MDAPAELAHLVRGERWSTHQNPEFREPDVRAPALHAVLPHEDKLWLLAPPWRTIADEIADARANGSQFWDEFGALEEIDPRLSPIRRRP